LRRPPRVAFLLSQPFLVLQQGRQAMRFVCILSTLAVTGMLCGCQDAPPPQAPALPQVTAAEPVVKTIIDWDEFVGRFEPAERVEVRPRVSGYLVAAHFEEGQQVERGEL